MTLNIPLIDQSIDWLATQPHDQPQFDMMTFGTDIECGTSCCIAGFIHHTVDPVGYAKAMDDTLTSNLPANASPTSSFCVAMKALGLDEDAAYDLFYAKGNDGADDLALGEITPEMAIATLVRLKETGRVEWVA